MSRRQSEVSHSGLVLDMRATSRTYADGAQEVVALDAVDFSVAPGEFVAVMGPSGSGKSSLLNLAGGLDTASSGEVVVEGKPLAGLSAKDLARLRRRSIGMVFQDFNLLPGLTALENVTFPLELDGMPWREAKRHGESLLAECGIAHLEDRRPEDMSGGQSQRVAIARALAGERRLILADEPTGALDSDSGRMVLELLRERADEGVAVVMVTHEARFAAWADRTVYLRDGKISGETSPSNPDSFLRDVGAK